MIIVSLKQAFYLSIFGRVEYFKTFRIYEYCVYESGGIFSEGLVSPYVSTYSCMNLADIYYSIGKSDKALDLYGKAAGRETRNYTRSEIFYRIANIYFTDKDNKNALRSLDYALMLYPNNARAALLKEKILPPLFEKFEVFFCLIFFFGIYFHCFCLFYIVIRKSKFYYLKNFNKK